MIFNHTKEMAGVDDPEKDRRGQKAFLSHMRHELRTPINAIIGYGEMLLEDLSEEQREFSANLISLHGQGKQLLKMINDLLDDDRVEQVQRDHGMEQFGAQVRRELSTVIGAILSNSDRLVETAMDRNQQEMLSDLRRIHTAAERLSSLVEGIGSLSGVSRDTVQYQTRSSLLPAAVVSPSQNSHLGKETVRSVREGALLLVDDSEMNRDLISRQLEREGYTVHQSENGRIAMDDIQSQDFDLILLDLMMPEINGFEVLKWLKSEETHKHIPVLMISALDELDSVVHCIEAGADDYLQKPINPTLLRARIRSSLEKKRLRDRERAFLNQLSIEQEKSEKLLLNILPKPIIERLKQGETHIADSFKEVTVLFSDLVNFTKISANIPPAELVSRISEIFSTFDMLAERYELEKIKTIGDAYMIVGGVPTPRADHAQAVAEMALDMLDAIKELREASDQPFDIRIGIHTGSVVAGIIGMKKFAYDLWGDTVNTASRMESHGIPGCIQISSVTHDYLQGLYHFEDRGRVWVKGKGELNTFLLKGRLS